MSTTWKMNRLGHLSFIIVLFLILQNSISAKSLFPLTEQQQKKWLRFWDEHQGHKLIMHFSAEYKPQTLAIVGVHVIPMTGKGILKRQTVIVRNGRIVEIGPDSRVRPPKGANVITPINCYMIPGLTESHSHTILSLNQFLVYLTRGVTTLREMDGWPWMLQAREMAAKNELLIPSLYVCGHILSNKPFDFFMTGVDSAEKAKDLVRQQASAGYDFIKIHDSMPEDSFQAMFEAAKGKGVDVVGHLPDEISMEKAFFAGIRTLEHFKGYIVGKNFEITDHDYVRITGEANIWNTPTFATYHDHLRGSEAWRLAEEENSIRLVPRWLRRFWYRVAAQEPNELGVRLQTVYAKKRKVFQELMTVTDKFLAGTDTGTYSFIVPGYALQEEIRIFEELGLNPYESLKTATLNPAIAMRKEDEFGTIEVGKRADFVILTKNPMEGTANLASIFGVSVRGTWLHRDALKRIEDGLAEAFRDDASPPEAALEVFERMVSEMEVLKSKGFPYPDYLLEEFEIFLNELKQKNLADRIADMQTVKTPIPTP